MTLREQLMLKRVLRRVRTWAPPISIGVILGAGLFLVSERIEARPETFPAAAERSAIEPSSPNTARP